jgi:hypothetical protein
MAGLERRAWILVVVKSLTLNPKPPNPETRTPHRYYGATSAAPHSSKSRYIVRYDTTVT